MEDIQKRLSELHEEVCVAKQRLDKVEKKISDMLVELNNKNTSTVIHNSWIRRRAKA